MDHFPPLPPILRFPQTYPSLSKYGATRYTVPINLPWKSDIETFAESSAKAYGLHLESHIVSAYRIDDLGRSGEYTASSIIEHCVRYEQARGTCAVAKKMNAELRGPAELVLGTEIEDLLKWAVLQKGEVKAKTLERVEHLKVILLLGQRVRLEQRNCYGKYITVAEGSLEEFGDGCIFVDGKFSVVDDDDLLRDLWRVTSVAKKEKKDDGEEEKDIDESNESNESGEGGFERVEAERTEKNGGKDIRSHKKNIKFSTPESVLGWIREFSPEQREWIRDGLDSTT